VRNDIIVSHSSRTIHDDKNIYIVNPISWQGHTCIKGDYHIVHIRHCHINYCWNFIPVPTDIALVSISKLTCPARFNIAELITSIPWDQVIIITAIIKKIDSVPTNFSACVWSSVISPPRTRIPHFNLARLSTSVPRIIVPVVTLIMTPVYPVSTNLIAIVRLIVIAICTLPAIFYFTDICTSISICVGKSRNIYFYRKIIVISNSWRTC